MRRHPGHFTTSDPATVRAAFGKSEGKRKNGQWVKIAKGKVFHGSSRQSVRDQAAAAE